MKDLLDSTGGEYFLNTRAEEGDTSSNAETTAASTSELVRGALTTDTEKGVTQTELERRIEEMHTKVLSLPWVRKCEYNPGNGFFHITVGNRYHSKPYQIVETIENLGFSTEGLFIFFKEMLPEKDENGGDTYFTQHLRYSPSGGFKHSNGFEVGEAKRA